MSSEKKNELIPKLDTSKYLASQEIWTELSVETNRLGKLIDEKGSDLSPNEFKKAKELAKNVRDYVTVYRKSVTEQATAYKKRIERELSVIGYDKIDEFMKERQEESKKEISDRLNTQLGIFNNTVAAEMVKTTHVKSSALANQVSNLLLKRFPKVNSGAKNNEIKKWKPIESVIHMSITTVDSLLREQPVIVQLPSHSKTLRGLAAYLESGDQNQLTNVSAWLDDDKPLIQRLALKSRVKTADSTINEMSNVLNSTVDDTTKLNRIRMLLNVYDANQ